MSARTVALALVVLLSVLSAQPCLQSVAVVDDGHHSVVDVVGDESVPAATSCEIATTSSVLTLQRPALQVRLEQSTPAYLVTASLGQTWAVFPSGDQRSQVQDGTLLLT